MLIATEAFWFGAVLAIALGVFVTLTRLQNWVAKRIAKKRAVKLIVFRHANRYEYPFPTIQDAARAALDRQGASEIIANGKTVWLGSWFASDLERDRLSLEELAK